MRAAFALALALSACGPAPALPPAPGAASPAAAVLAAETKALETASDLLHAGPAAARMPFYLEDAEMIPPGGAVTGAAEIRRIYGAAERGPAVRFARQGLQLSASADMAVERGRWSAEGDAAAGGDYVIVWRKDAQGQWRVLYDISNDAGPQGGSGR